MHNSIVVVKFLDSPKVNGGAIKNIESKQFKAGTLKIGNIILVEGIDYKVLGKK